MQPVQDTAARLTDIGPLGINFQSGVHCSYNVAVQFDWDKRNRTHIARHGVTVMEVEQVFTGRPLRTPPYIRKGEVRVMVVGRAATGRQLSVVFAMAGEKVRVVTAYDAGAAEKEQYAQYQKSQIA